MANHNITEYTRYKYFGITMCHQFPNRKSRRYMVQAHRPRPGAISPMAFIKWYAPWRKYCFYPAPDTETVWSSGCLADIQDFLDKLNEKKKA